MNTTASSSNTTKLRKTETYGSMSEQYPLLCDDLSEEERFSPQFHRRLMSRDRVKNHMKGAALIFTRWPEHWTTLLNYWWIGVGMIALSTYILYNCLFSYAMLQPTTKHYPKPVNIKSTKLIPKLSTPPKVFMHIFVDDKQEIDLNDYLPYIEIITKKYKHFQYELIIVANDTDVGKKQYNEKENNKIALNMLWENEFIPEKVLSNNSNFNIKYVTLSKYLNDSPLKKNWKTLPHQFIQLLVRAASIWEKGGISFDPIILTPQSPHSIYIDKVYNILKKYKAKKETLQTPRTNLKLRFPSRKSNALKVKPNNIRDVINALETDGSTLSYQDPLLEAETADKKTIHFGRQLRSIAESIINQEVKTKPMKLKDTKNKKLSDEIHHEDSVRKDLKNDRETSSKLNLLPLFLDFLFHNKQSKTLDETTENSVYEQSNKQSKSVDLGNNTLQGTDFWRNLLDRNVYKPVIISAKGIFEKPDNLTKYSEVETEVEHLFDVTIDLKGNIIVTDMPCHAFIGNMFTNAVHHDKNENITDFVIKELSIFCNGLLASCVGIDVILL